MLLEATTIPLKEAIAVTRPQALRDRLAVVVETTAAAGDLVAVAEEDKN